MLLRCERYGRKLSLLLTDIDHFKSVNDTYGHPVGDKVLKRVAQVLAAQARRTDLVARYGGEEFAMLLYDVDVPAVDKLAERIRKGVVALALEHRDSRVGVVTISIGAAVVEPSAERRARGAVQLADEALYQAKTRGRNRVEVLAADAHKALETGVFAKQSGLR
jgi:two-component system cell cycle response regulator